jgi:YegS/Rv2252/BmrU family lipid kinase
MKVERIKVIVNPAAGRDEAIFGTLNDVFRPAGVGWDIAVTNAPGEAEGLSAAAAEEGYDCVAACGGDGTVMEVATGLVGGKIPLAILPEGTGNAMAIELGIPPELADAAALIAGGLAESRLVDMGTIGDHKFLLRLGISFEAAMKENLSRGQKQEFGPLAYVLSGFKALLDPSVAEYTLDVDGRIEKCSGIACIVANSGSTGIAGISLAQGIDVSDGLLDVVVFDAQDLPGLLGLAGGVAVGSEPKGVTHFAGRIISVDASPPQDVTSDGEDAGTTPVTARVMPKAISVLVPPQTSDPEQETRTSAETS